MARLKQMCGGDAKRLKVAKVAKVTERSAWPGGCEWSAEVRKKTGKCGATHADIS